LGVEQFDRGGGPMGSGIEIGGHPATTKRGLVIQTELVMSPYGGLPAAIGNDLASAVSEGETRQNQPQTYSQIQHWEHQRLVKDRRRLGRQKIKN
jgi:hypothetical protein